MEITNIMTDAGNDGGARSLSRNRIGDVGAVAIGEALKTNTTLSELVCVKSGREWRLTAH